ncbi:MAG: MBL fold metallo-hydrolase [Alphaproteobacteria bacterium]|nr:MAG: MBL fold metallo-hydrolase [Alphaproteobacteria bacterium]
MKISFWGTRGSLPCPGARYTKYGGNTSCISITTSNGELVIDAGTGLRNYGNARQGKATQNLPNVYHIALSHFHYDHIIGIPFFKPLWDPNAIIHFYSGTCAGREDLERVLRLLFREPFLPMCYDDIPATLILHTLTETQSIEIFSGVCLRVFPLNHPGGACGYSVSEQGKSVAYVSDHEHSQQGEKNLTPFLHGHDLMIFDAFFCNETYRAGWGHSTWEQGVSLAKSLNIPQVALFHHHIECDDGALDILQNQISQVFSGAFFAREGTTVTLTEAF